MDKLVNSSIDTIARAVPAWEEAQRQAAELLGSEGLALLDKAAKKRGGLRAEG